MELVDLGFDSWFQAKLQHVGQRNFCPARVTRVDRERLLVRNEYDEVPAEPTGKLRFSADSAQELPCVGDWVLVQLYNDGTLAIVHEVLPRRTSLRRKSAGDKIEYQMVASNIDVASSCSRATSISTCAGWNDTSSWQTKVMSSL
jgi:ribosome biogenesis GTPase